MRRFCVYTSLQIKRILHYVPFVFLVTLVICLSLTLALVTLINDDNSAADQKKIGIGIVGDFENSYLGLGLSALTSFDSSRFFLDIAEFDEADASEKLLDGEIYGYVVIPEGFVDDAMHGNVGKLRFVTTDTTVDIINILKHEVLELISCVLVESQNGIYGMQDALLRHGVSHNKVMDVTNQMAVEYMGLILNRSNALELEVIGVSDGLSFGGYLLSGFCVLMMLLSGIVCCPLFVCQDYTFPKLMSANRYGTWIQTAGEYLSFFLAMAINTTSLLLLMMLGTGSVSQVVPELAGRGIAHILLLLVKFIPAIALITAMQYLLYQLSDSVVSGVLMQFVSAVLLGYVSGCFYPISFFPKALRLVSDALPSGMVRGYFSSLVTGNASLRQILAILTYTAILLVLSGLIRYRRIKKI